MPGELSHQSARDELLGKLTARDGYFGIALPRSVAQAAIDVVLADVVAVLDKRYSPQVDKVAAALTMAPADLVTKAFELPGHEGLRYG